MSWFVAGGFPMVFVTLFGCVAVADAARFAAQPAPGRLDPIKAYGVAVALAALAGVAVDLSVVARFVANDPELSVPGTFGPAVLAGIGEALAPAILGGAVLSVVALLSAVGLRRMPPA